MAEPIPHTFPASKLGEYKVIEEIAEGTFGKVKSECCEGAVIVDGNSMHAFSGSAHHHWTQGSYEVHLETSHCGDQDEESRST